MSTPEPIRLNIRELLQHSGWMRRFARRLVEDPQRADDLVQQTWVAALERPPRHEGRQRAWLGSVLRRLAARTYRSEARREARERTVARDELLDDEVGGAGIIGVETLVERAELQQQIARCVLDLDEPYRVTVLLRFYEELSTAEVADRLGVPESTVRTRLRRALERTREKLDASHGGRAQWGAILLPLGTFQVGTVQAGGAAASQLTAYAKAVTSTSSATALSTSTTAVAAVTFGGIFMAKAVVGLILVSVVAAGLGYWLGSDSQSAVVEDRSAEIESPDAALVDANEALAAKVASLEEANKTLASENSELKSEIAKSNVPEPATSDEVSLAEALAISFGEFSALPELRDTDWETLAAAIIEIDDDVVKLEAALAAGEGLDAEAQQRIFAQQAKLQSYAIKLIGKLPTHASGNGEFSHPISVANMISAYLDVGEQPLSNSQRGEITSLGEEYNRSFDDLNSGYDDSTYQLEKLLDEVSLKNDFVSQMYGALDPDQADFVVRPSIRGRAALDTFSPAVMLMMKATPLSVDSPADLRSALVARVSAQFPDDQDRLANSRVFDTWVQEVESLLEPQPRYLHGMFKAEEATVAGYAQIRALKALADELGLSEEARARLRELQLMVVPRVNPAD